MEKVYIQVSDSKMPERATEGSAGYDLCASKAVTIKSGEFEKVPTGVRISMPQGMECQIRPRSGLAGKYGVTVLNAPGTIDSDYRGEICVILINHGKKDFVIEPGMRIAQMVFAHVTQVQFEEVDKLDETARGAGGFGSTGV